MQVGWLSNAILPGASPLCHKPIGLTNQLSFYHNFDPSNGSSMAGTAHTAVPSVNQPKAALRLSHPKHTQSTPDMRHAFWQVKNPLFSGNLPLKLNSRSSHWKLPQTGYIWVRRVVLFLLPSNLFNKGINISINPTHLYRVGIMSSHIPTLPKNLGGHFLPHTLQEFHPYQEAATLKGFTSIKRSSASFCTPGRCDISQKKNRA